MTTVLVILLIGLLMYLVPPAGTDGGEDQRAGAHPDLLGGVLHPGGVRAVGGPGDAGRAGHFRFRLLSRDRKT